MSGPALTVAQLLKYKDEEFNKTVEEMNLQGLLDTITVLQKEMGREQENFNSLSSELSSLNKNSRQYKQISKELNVSQAKLTTLMNRSMRCFSQQGNRKPGTPVQRRSSLLGSSSQKTEPANSDLQRRHSDKLNNEQAAVLKSIVASGVRTYSNPNILENNLTSADKAQPLPSMRIKPPLASLNDTKMTVKKTDSPKQTGALVAKQEFKTSIQNTQPKTQTASKVFVSGLKDANFNPQSAKSETPLPVSSTVISVNSGRAESPSQSVHNGIPTAGSGRVVTKSAWVAPLVSSSHVSATQANVTNGSVDDKNKHVSSTKITLGSSASGQKNKRIQDNVSEPVRSNSFTQITLKGPSEDSLTPQRNIKVRPSSAVVSGEQNLSGRDEKTDKTRPSSTIISGQKSVNIAPKVQQPAVIFHGSRPHVLDPVLGENKNKMLEEIKRMKKYENDENVSDRRTIPEQTKNSKPDQNKPQPLSSDGNDRDKFLQEIRQFKRKTEEDSETPKQKVVPESREAPSKSAEDDTLRKMDELMNLGSAPSSPLSESEDAIPKEEDVPISEPDRYVSEVRMPEKTPVKEAVSTKMVVLDKQNGENAAIKGDSPKREDSQGAIPKKTVLKNGEDVERFFSSPVPLGVEKEPASPTSQVGAESNAEHQEDEELVKSRVNLSIWDPSKLLTELYTVNLMPDNAEDISHKFIGMEGLMEKLPMNKKKATLLKTWKRRYFRAKDGWLHYYETNNRDKPSDSIQLMGGKIDDLGNRILGIDDGRGRYLMVRCPTEKEYGNWKVALESQTADNVRATYIRPVFRTPPHPSKKILIIDIGSSAIRAGVLGESPALPQVFFPSIVATDKSTGEITIGIDAFKPQVRRSSNLSYPIRPTNKVDKFNIDMDVMPKIFQKVFKELGVNPKQYWLMLCTPQNLGDKMRSDLMQILIDQFLMQGVCMVQQALLALYSYSATSGIIVDIGERMEILPIYDGYVIEGGVSRQAYGGQKVCDSLSTSLMENKYKFFTPVGHLIIRYVMEKSCFVTEDYKEAKKSCDDHPENFQSTVGLDMYDLPLGAHTSVTHDYSRFKSPEGFFDTDLWGMDYPKIHNLVFRAVQASPMDSRKHMYRSVYLSGGVTMLPGFAERLQMELTKLAPPSILVEVHASPQRYHSAFIGACSVAGMEQFTQSCISADEWKKHGAKAFQKWKMA